MIEDREVSWTELHSSGLSIKDLADMWEENEQEKADNWGMQSTDDLEAEEYLLSRGLVEEKVRAD